MLNHQKNEVPYQMYASRYSKCLQEKYGLTEELAVWTIESWAYAFGILKDDMFDLEEEIEEFIKSKKLWERGGLPWFWWTTVGFKKELELSQKIKKLR
jgi:hypothetical protein